ncbi:tRNA lysidine(34) synthetase TilS [Paracoccus sp. 1_MG-2023]|uniref:tRNA lysidine(34) synthetase TilS n=1 Tax=unclassified Paracoccus (in: a-proteobacteria) TaxID=2688777 RepID=UPI001C09C943|nr:MULTISPECIES: tRNA lysidine(34) synthetase TilS [unclassified Paracoccus (in: a-proteobacteria)]MBU2957528.1 tRNA lysidine(34) synthetase TilS [Paracoccus sp. C2R09]MDO6669812.1 tRNA lysidine(34) synthetase TilS [Paracoccus sp. 1_MG-2023]
MSDVASRIRGALDRLAGDRPALGLAVSGGGDSVTLMRVAAEWAGGRKLMVATVDHGLRSDSGAEAERTARMARALGLPHAILLWKRETQAGNLMAQARDARLRLLSAWAQRNDLPAVALGHTADDLAETLLMRLGRGSGIDGLAAMAEWRDAFGMRWLRPMLGVGRAETRDWLRGQGAEWIDDPTNENTDYERVRTRRAIAALGLDVSGLARSARHISEARQALSDYASLLAKGAEVDRGSLILPRHVLRDSPTDIRRRLLVASCRWVTGADYPPRRATLLHALDALRAQARVTLDGCLVSPMQGDCIRITREAAAASRAMPATEGVWDRRWRIGTLPEGHHVAALGTAALEGRNWRRSGLLRDEAAASPAIWKGDMVVDAPLLRDDPDDLLRPLRGAADFRSLVKAH